MSTLKVGNYLPTVKNFFKFRGTLVPNTNPPSPTPNSGGASGDGLEANQKSFLASKTQRHLSSLSKSSKTNFLKIFMTAGELFTFKNHRHLI